MDAIGSSDRPIRSILSRLRMTPNLVTLYAKFTNVPPDVVKLDLSKSCRKMYNPEICSMIVTIPGRPHDSITGELNSQFAVATYLANMKDTFGIGITGLLKQRTFVPLFLLLNKPFVQ